MYQKGETIEETLKNMQQNTLVLPAIQREFVWKPEQIYRYFDSIMQRYPFGTLLFWRVEQENSDKFNFYDFVIDFHELNNRHCPVLPVMHNTQLTAVLDGQQRLTALNIGLRGSIAWKLPRKHRNNPFAYPKRILYLDLLWQPDYDESQIKYRFKFLTQDEAQNSQYNGCCWFPVKNILSMSDPGPAMTAWLTKRLRQEQVVFAHKILFQLYEVVRSKELVWFYEEKDQNLDKVLQIFIRMNSGSTVLQRSDLLLSIAVAQWRNIDAREAIHTFVDELNNIGNEGFFFSKDLVLKAGLMFCDVGSVGFKVENFNRRNMKKLESNWENIQSALKLTVQLISRFGFHSKNLTAKNAILPIAYYLYHFNHGEKFLTHSEFSQERKSIFEWLARSLLKSGVWGSGLDTLLTALREIIKKSNGGKFPVNSIREEMARRGKSFAFEKEELEDLVDIEYQNRLTFALLSLLFPFVDLSNKFHIDHIFPRAYFKQKQLQELGMDENLIKNIIDNSNRLGNLQLLEGPMNLEKGKQLPHDWLEQSKPDLTDRKHYMNLHNFGDLPKNITDFENFYDNRRNSLKAKLREILGR